MASDAYNRELARDQLVILLDAKLVSGGTQYAYVVSNGRYDGLAGQSPVVQVFSNGSRRTPFGLPGTQYTTRAVLQIQVLVLDAKSDESRTQQDVEDQLDQIEKLIADVVADNRSVADVWDRLDYFEGFTQMARRVDIDGNQYEVEIINLIAEANC